jgi:drug/metabolite transporter (DMT)-like permease
MLQGPRPEAAPMPLILAAPTDNMRGVAWMLVSVVGATAMTVLVRGLSAEMHTSMIAFLRSVMGLLFVAPLILRQGGAARLMGVSRPGLHLLRGALTAVSINLGFYAIWRLPLATATILFFLAPIFSTMLAPFMIGERVGVWRWSAIAVAFAGALIVLRPGGAPLDLGVAAAVVSSMTFAVSLLLGKTASAADGSATVFASSAILTAVLTLPMALFAWSMPASAVAWATLFALTCAGSLRGYADIRAFACGEASVVGPISYLRLPSVALAGWILFGETTDAFTWAGGAVIVGAALVIALRERTPRAARAAPPSPTDD